MRTTGLLPDSTVRPIASPVFFQGGENGILLLHGFTGHPGNLRYLGRRLNENGYTVSIPRLPGHGTSARDFMNTTARDWLRRCVDSYLDLKTVCTSVYVAGHSMGGLFTILLASMFKPEKIALLAPAITNTNRLIVFTPLARHFIGRLPFRSGLVPANADEEYMLKEYWSFRWMGPSAELYGLQKTARRTLHGVTSDTLLMVSEKDPVVPLAAADIIERKIASRNLKKIILREGGHVFVDDTEKETVARAVIEWFGSPAQAAGRIG